MNRTLLAKVPTDLLYQALETEKGGVQVYSTALRCAVNKDLREEWNKYLEETKNHVQILSDILIALELDPDAETPGRKVVRYIGTSLVKAMGREFAKIGPSQGGTFFAWVTDGAGPDEMAAITSGIPKPVFTVITGIFGRNYRKQVAPVWRT